MLKIKKLNQFKDSEISKIQKWKGINPNFKKAINEIKNEKIGNIKIHLFKIIKINKIYLEIIWMIKYLNDEEIERFLLFLFKKIKEIKFNSRENHNINQLFAEKQI